MKTNNNGETRVERQKNQATKQYISFRFLSLLPLACIAIYLIAQVTRRQIATDYSTVVEPHDDILQMINRTCSTIPFQAPNKPSGMVVDRMFNWNATEFPEVIDLHPALDIARNNLMEIEIPRAMKNIMMPNQLASAIKPEHQRRFYEYCVTLGLLREIYSLHAMALKVGMGNCGEHAAYAAFEIIKLSLALEQNIKVARIEGTDAKYKTTHSFILVDSDLPYAMLQSQKSIKEYLKSANNYRSGLICDTWNEGLFTTPAATKNPLYSLNNKAELTVAPYHLDFDYSGLPTVAVDYLKDSLSQMGLKSLHGKPKVRFFDRWSHTAAKANSVDMKNSPSVSPKR